MATPSTTTSSGKMIAPYANRKPCAPQKVLPFQIPCITTAARKPRMGARTRVDGRRVETAIPMPMPVAAVKSGCANGAMIPRQERHPELPGLQRL